MLCSANFYFVSLNSFVRDDRTIRRVNLDQDGFIFSFYLSKDAVIDSELVIGDKVKVELNYFPKTGSNSLMLVRSIERVF